VAPSSAASASEQIVVVFMVLNPQRLLGPEM